MKAFFSRSYFCNPCNDGYNNRGDHRCIETCPYCYSVPACKEVKSKFCRDCRRYFRSEQCFEKHKIIKANESRNLIKKRQDQYQHQSMTGCKFVANVTNMLNEHISKKKMWLFQLFNM